MDLFEEVLTLLWIVLPAYIANGTPVVGARILDKMGYRRHPIDKGKLFIDGRRVFGDNKTWEGFLTGIASGILTGFIQSALNNFNYLYLARGVVFSVGAMIGDLLGAFIKRRLGIEPGDPLPFVDQTLFLFVAISVAYPLNLVSLTLMQLLILTVITMFLHITTNYLAYKFKLKRVPW